MWHKWTVHLFIIALFCGTDSFSWTNGNYPAEISEVLNGVLNEYENKVIDIDNADCVAQIRSFLNNLVNSTGDDIWALRMIDAAPKMPSGILEFNLGLIGRYDECLNIKSELSSVKGKYCLAAIDLQFLDKLTPPEIQYHSHNLIRKDNEALIIPAVPAIGMCIPDQCTEGDVRRVFASVLSIIPWSVTCQTEETLRPTLGTGAIATLCFFGFFVLLMALSTGYDLLSDRDKKFRSNQLLLAFSVYTNGKKLFRVSAGSGEFTAIHGIRFFSMVWVIYGHMFFATIYGPLSNLMDVPKFMNKTESMIIGNAAYSVDTFFLLSGMFVVYGFMKAIRTTKFNLFQYYLHRYLRLAPPLVPVILTTLYLVPYLGSGPFYPALQGTIVTPCELRWWMSLLFIQNYIHDAQICVNQTWYLGVDWQLYMIAPVFLLFLPKRPKIGLSILSLGLVASMLSAGLVTWKYKLSATPLNLYGKLVATNVYYYLPTHTRASSWIIGTFLGYILAKIQLENNLIYLKLPKWLVIFTWAVVLSAIPVCIFAGNDTLISQTYHPYSNLFFNIFARPAWCLCVSWIIFACAIDYGGIINRILSWPLFQVLNRFTYSMYLIHLSIFYLMSFSQKYPAYFSMFDLSYRFWGGFALTFSISIFWVLAFESPVVALEKCLLRKPPKNPANKGGSNGTKQEA